MKILILLSVCIIFFCCKSHHEGYEEKVRKTITYIDKGEYADAMNQVNRLIIENEHLVSAHTMKGIIFSLLKSEKAAIEEYKRSLLIDRVYAPALFNTGTSFSILEQHDSAIVYYNLALETFRKGDFNFEETAKPDLDEADKWLKVSISQIRYERGLSFFASGKDSLALEDFYFSLRANWSGAESQYYIGIILLMHSNHLGCRYLEQALKNGEMRAEEYLNKYCRNVNKQGSDVNEVVK